MKESYGEGLATHTDPESCVFTREGRRADLLPWRRSVDRGTHRPGIEPRKKVLAEGADAVRLCGKQHGLGRYRRAQVRPSAV